MRIYLTSLFSGIALAFPAVAEEVPFPVVKLPEPCQHCFDVLGVSSRTPCDKISLPAEYRQTGRFTSSLSEGGDKSPIYLSKIIYSSTAGGAKDELSFACSTPLTGNVVERITRQLTIKSNAPSVEDTVSAYLKKYGHPSFALDVGNWQTPQQLLAFSLDANLNQRDAHASSLSLQEADARHGSADYKLARDIGFELSVVIFDQSRVPDIVGRGPYVLAENLADFALIHDDDQLAEKFRDELRKKARTVNDADPTKGKPAGGPVLKL